MHNFNCHGPVHLVTSAFGDLHLVTSAFGDLHLVTAARTERQQQRVVHP